MLRELAPNLWVTERPQRFGGVEVGTRMTVIRLPEEKLFLHSPVTLDAGLRGELGRLGVPRFVVAPNRFHHLYAGEYTRAYPDLALFVAPGLETKRPDLAVRGVLNADAPPGWRDQIDQLLVHGYPLLNEVVFLHRASRTLIVSDLVFNIHDDSPSLTRLIFRLIGAYGRCGPSLLERILVRDRAAARDSLTRILTWDFDRVILAHGRLLESGGGAALRDGYAWLL
ncbi:MAG TPA: DUF4336 domain-containing protein [Candidatus Binatia bacterium]